MLDVEGLHIYIKIIYIEQAADSEQEQEAEETTLETSMSRYGRKRTSETTMCHGKISL